MKKKTLYQEMEELFDKYNLNGIRGDLWWDIYNLIQKEKKKTKQRMLRSNSDQ